jgi:galactitol-specific phosphotransferase system IIB component
MLEHFNLEKVTSFDFDKKYKIIKHKNIVFIKLRFYEIAKWNTLLSEIFKKQIEVKDENVSKTKSYYDVFKLFTESYKIPREYLTSLKTEKRFLTYNTKKEQKQYLKKWLEKSKG